MTCFVHTIYLWRDPCQKSAIGFDVLSELRNILKLWCQRVDWRTLCRHGLSLDWMIGLDRGGYSERKIFRFRVKDTLLVLWPYCTRLNGQILEVTLSSINYFGYSTVKNACTWHQKNSLVRNTPAPRPPKFERWRKKIELLIRQWKTRSQYPIHTIENTLTLFHSSLPFKFKRGGGGYANEKREGFIWSGLITRNINSLTLCPIILKKDNQVSVCECFFSSWWSRSECAMSRKPNAPLPGGCDTAKTAIRPRW